MKIEEYVSGSYLTIQPYSGISTIEDKLLISNYLVVIDPEGIYYGILTPSDVIRQKHKLVIDCLAPVETISMADSITDVLSKFHLTHSEALPVFNHNEFIGVIEKNNVLEKLKAKTERLYHESVISKEVRSVFLHNLSHEIRTPLNQFLGFIDLVADFSPDELKSRGEEYNAIIKNSSEQFLNTMNDLIEISLLHSGESLSIQYEVFSTEDLLSELKDYFETIFRNIKPEIEISYTNPDPSFRVYSDGKRIKQVLSHLIDRAIRHATGRKIIRFGYNPSKDRQQLCFYVKNTNTKITDLQKAMIVEGFQTESLEQNSNPVSLGFGMDLIKKIAELLDGSLTMSFDEDNILTAFFSIPLHEKNH